MKELVDSEKTAAHSKEWKTQTLPVEQKARHSILTRLVNGRAWRTLRAHVWLTPTPLSLCTCAQPTESFLFDTIFGNSLSARHQARPHFKLRISSPVFPLIRKIIPLASNHELLTQCPSLRVCGVGQKRAPDRFFERVASKFRKCEKGR